MSFRSVVFAAFTLSTLSLGCSDSGDDASAAGASGSSGSAGSGGSSGSSGSSGAGGTAGASGSGGSASGGSAGSGGTSGTAGSAGAGGTAGVGGAAGAAGTGGTAGTAVTPIGGDRPATVYVPSSYVEGSPAPLVILLHGYSVSGAIQETYFSLQAQADLHGFLYVHPDGTIDSSGKRFWNATDACCNFDASTVDDDAYLMGLVEEISSRYTVDPKRVYFIGHSNGGFMAHRLACNHADKIAAIVSLAGAQYKDVSKCNPSEPVSVLQIHGDADETISFSGGNIVVGGVPIAYPSATETVQDWATLNGCTLTPDTSAAPLDLITNTAGAETTIASYAAGCQAGGHAELWTASAGPHAPGLTAAFRSEIIDFLISHPKP